MTEDWERILEGRYRNVQDLGEYICLELLNDPDCGHPFNRPCCLDDKLQQSGYMIKCHDPKTRVGNEGRYIRVEFWKKEYLKKAESIEEIENNIRAYQRRNANGIKGVFTDEPLITKDMAYFLIAEYGKMIDQLRNAMMIVDKRLNDDFYPEAFNIPKPCWDVNE